MSLCQTTRDDWAFRQQSGLDATLRLLTDELLTICWGADAPLKAGLGALVAARGKRLRPTLAYLCWHMAKEPGLDVLPLMLMLELMHTASLIHDDIVDGADTRRGTAALHTLVGERAAVQGADYLLACAMERLHVYRGTGINELLTGVSLEMCLGELWQRDALAGRQAQTEESYFVQIWRKTAALIAAACRAGAIAAGLDVETTRRLGRFGENLGMAFQMRDDLMDFTGQGLCGKPVGLDEKAGLMTLPTLLALAGADRQEAARQTEQQIWAHSADAVSALEGLQGPEAAALSALAGRLAKRLD